MLYLLFQALLVLPVVAITGVPDTGQADLFVVELINSYDNTTSLDDNVYAIMTLLCPESVYCPGTYTTDKSQTDKLIYESVFNSTYRDVIVSRQYIMEKRDFLNICCKACSCAVDCHEKQNCCPKMKRETPSNKSNIKQTCTHASLQSIQNSDYSPDEFYGHSFYMVNRCYNATPIHNDIFKRCTRPNVSVPEDVIPVFSESSGRIYRNSHCAICNNDHRIIPWRIEVALLHAVLYDGGTFFPSTSMDLFHFILEHNRFGHITFLPPVQMNVLVEDHLCLNMKTGNATQCKRTPPHDEDHNKFLQRACDGYEFVYSSLINGGHNLFCKLCSMRKFPPEIPTCRSDIKVFDLSFTALLSFDGRSVENPNVPNQSLESDRPTPGECKCYEHYHIPLRSCMPLYCPIGEFFVDCSCRRFLKMISGVSVRLFADLVPVIPMNETTILETATGDDFAQQVRDAIHRVFSHSNDHMLIFIRNMVMEITTDAPAIIHCQIMITFSKEMDFKEMALSVFNRLKHIQYLVIKHIPMRLLRAEEYDAKDIFGERNSISSSEIINLRTKYGGKLSFKNTIPLNKLLFCVQMTLSENDVSQLKNMSSIKGYTASDVYYVYRAADKRMCVEDYKNIFCNTTSSSERFHIINKFLLTIFITLWVCVYQKHYN